MYLYLISGPGHGRRSLEISASGRWLVRSVHIGRKDDCVVSKRCWNRTRAARNLETYYHTDESAWVVGSM